MKHAWVIVLLLGSATVADTPAPVFNVMNYGALPDGKTDNDTAVQKAIDACARAGGGTVYFPAGNFLSGTVALKSNVTLHLAPGATLWGSRLIEDYELPHLIYARDADNIAIEGGGTINGQGEAFWDANFRPLAKRPSPLIELVNCRNVRIQDVNIRNAPGWTIHPKNCDGVRIRGISIINHLRGPNTDGIGPDSSRNVHISDSYIEAGDDCIVLKTTGQGGPVRPCENVTVTNCVLVSDDAALKLGTESLADIRHCVFSNCVIHDTRVGIALYAKDGATFEDISFSNIAIQTRPTHPNDVEWAIVIDLEKRKEDSPLSTIRDVNFSDLRIYTKGRVLAEGMPEKPLEDLSFRNILMRVTGFEPLEKVSKPRGSSNVRQAGREINYGSAPAALIFANVRGVNLRDVRVVWDTAETPQERHAIYGARVADVRINGFSGRQAAPGGRLATIALEDAKDIFVTGSRAEEGANVFLQVIGGRPEEVVLEGNDLRKARRAVEPASSRARRR